MNQYKKNNIKQATFLVICDDELTKKEIFQSNLVLIRDWKFGLFEVPASMKERFKEKFPILHCNIEHGVCKENISEDEIRSINISNWGSLIMAENL
ncbi:MAG: hypothetical protein IJO13_00395 [Lachnospiraceae bacterium]|nr:hypothetical protein [Lachnospiraceae bacterium]